MDRAVAAHVQPYYADQAEIDAGRSPCCGTVLGAPAPAPPCHGARVSYAQLRSAAPYDADAFRAFWTIMGMLRPPEEIYRDPELVPRCWTRWPPTARSPWPSPTRRSCRPRWRLAGPQGAHQCLRMTRSGVPARQTVTSMCGSATSTAAAPTRSARKKWSNFWPRRSNPVSANRFSA